MIKGYTNVEQSKTLAEFLPLESADMYYDRGGLPSLIDKYVTHESIKNDKYHHLIPCWSSSALLGVLPFHLIVNNQRYGFDMIKGLDKNGETYAIKYAIFNTTLYLHLTDYYNNPVDACYEMIQLLKEKNLIWK